MPDDVRRGKPRYEAPVVIALGELAKGMGECRAGASAAIGDCTGGIFAASYCTDAGNAAGTACTAGGTAPAACTAGTAGP